MQETTGKSLSQLAGELVVDGLNARRATNPDASAVDLLKRALVCWKLLECEATVRLCVRQSPFWVAIAQSYGLSKSRFMT